MRVIAGSARRLLLKTVEGADTRPTTDRIKETLFNILNPSLFNCRFLDLFSGSGAIGIEALSRGAGLAVFVENNRKAAACIRENLHSTHLEDRATVMESDVLPALRKLEAAQTPAFDMIFMDPPYDRQIEKEILTCLAHSELVNEKTLIIVEASLHTEPDYLTESGLVLDRSKEYKTNKHLFITKGESR